MVRRLRLPTLNVPTGPVAAFTRATSTPSRARSAGMGATRSRSDSERQRSHICSGVSPDSNMARFITPADVAST